MWPSPLKNPGYTPGFGFCLMHFTELDDVTLDIFDDLHQSEKWDIVDVTGSHKSATF